MEISNWVENTRLARLAYKSTLDGTEESCRIESFEKKKNADLGEKVREISKTDSTTVRPVHKMELDKSTRQYFEQDKPLINVQNVRVISEAPSVAITSLPLLSTLVPKSWCIRLVDLKYVLL